MKASSALLARISSSCGSVYSGNLIVAVPRVFSVEESKRFSQSKFLDTYTRLSLTGASRLEVDSLHLESM